MYEDVVTLVYVINMECGKDFHFDVFAKCSCVADFERLFKRYVEVWGEELGFKVTYDFVGLNYTKQFVKNNFKELQNNA